ncbi:Membrane-associated, eicosanoid/glutathione metabolism (MAPEG) protein [Cordyceps fumosorosea ARSEF 2679]|uniref:Membrane-associated, eicosanoid/glutathione metabolism (MAPEG) protein n=1 Tax=Cordyceps fumosorosea (strain ARSEF 2679) TaxID=1081104 RepID=A0A167LUU2_CORFA|nr:Membrane-associated, eicosanoid/glutathione metabolism (MAPEG) protein [Cordyceps fumosorosea ARSEF 2679]OAA53536.1 Membrane-associated, eicosanoid/glutathione metabolism (MAPEG) protein [Cordyceps fumosorosea ARSEF 2679]
MSFLTPFINGEASLAIGSLPLTLLIAALPHWYTIYQAEVNKVQGGWANENPRSFVARLNAKAASGKKLSELEGMILRGQAAQQNGFEWWAVWAAAVILGTLAKVPQADMTRYTVIHVACRLVYNYLYVVTSKRSLSYLRTIVFQVSNYPAVAIFFKAASALN